MLPERDGLLRHVVAEDDAQRAVVEAVGGADRLPVFVVGEEGEAIRRGRDVVGELRAVAGDPFLVLRIGGGDGFRRRGRDGVGGMQILLQRVELRGVTLASG